MVIMVNETLRRKMLKQIRGRGSVMIDYTKLG